MRRGFLVALLIVTLAPAPVAAQGGPPPNPETRPRVAPQYQPAFAGQFRAPGPRAASTFKVSTLATGLTSPWAIEALPDGRFLVTEKPGQMVVVDQKGTVSPPITGVLPVHPGLKGGLLDVALSPRFAVNRMIFGVYAEPRDGGSGTAIARARLDAGERSLSKVRVIWRPEETSKSVVRGRRVAEEEWLPIGVRARYLTQGLDGAVYLVTDEVDGKLLEVSR